MRKLMLGLLLVSAGACTVLAQERPWAEKLFKGTLTHDFGSVPRGGKIVYQFPVTNIYAVPLKFTNLRAECGCLGATAKPDTLQPQESGVVEVSIDTTRFSGAKSVRLHATVGPQFISTAVLTVSCIARSDVVLNPGQFHFGVVPQGKKVTQTVDVEYAGSFDWRVQQISKDAGVPIDVTIEELYRIGATPRSPGKVGYRVAVTLKENAPAGQLHRELHLETNDATSKVVNIAVDATIQANLTAAPSAVTLGSIKASAETTRKIQIRGNRPFRILGVDGAGSGVSVDLPNQPAANHIVTIHVQPAQAGELRKQLTFRTDLDGAAVTVTIEGTVTP